MGLWIAIDPHCLRLFWGEGVCIFFFFQLDIFCWFRLKTLFLVLLEKRIPILNCKHFSHSNPKQIVLHIELFCCFLVFGFRFSSVCCRCLIKVLISVERNFVALLFIYSIRKLLLLNGHVKFEIVSTNLTQIREYLLFL